MWAKAGRAAQSWATAAIDRSSPAHRHCLAAHSIRGRRSRIRGDAATPSDLAIMFSALVAVTAGPRFELRGAISRVLGLAIGVVVIDFRTGQPRATFGIRQLSDGIDIVGSRSDLSPAARRSGCSTICARRRPDVIPVGRPWMGRYAWSPVRGTVAARNLRRIPFRGRCRRGASFRPFPVLHHEKERDPPTQRRLR